MGYTPNEWHPLDVITSEKLNELEKGLTQTSENVVYGSGGAQQSSDGIHSLKYIEKGDALPNNPQVGDTVFMTDGDDFSILEWDGEQWNNRINPKLSERIQSSLTEAKAHTDEVKQGLSTDIDTAKSQAASQANTAEANAKSAATSQFTQAQSALSAAKSDLTNSIASEASARNTAVAAANSQAQSYANQAKADAMSAASSADGVIRTAISSSANSLSATITQNKSSADSGISTAQTIAQAAVDGLKTKVSQTDYNAKTGQLQTDLTTTTQTANKATTDIVSIKQTDTSQDARMTQIESDASGIKTTVSNLQTTQDKQTGDISTLQQRADGFDVSVAKINNVVNGLGQTNQLMNTEFTPDLQGWNDQTLAKTGVGTFNGSNILDLSGNSDFRQLFIPLNGATVVSASVYRKISISGGSGGRWSLMFYGANNAFISSVYGTYQTSLPDFTLEKLENISVPSGAQSVSLRFYSDGTVSIHQIVQPMLVFESTVGTYVQGNYNNNDALAKVRLTADQATLDLSTYKQDADGRISKAQTDITATANQVATKVSQTDYDTKTGQLTTGVSKAQQTADAVTTSLGNYKQDADGRISANSADIITNANAIKQKVAQSDYDANNTKLTSRLTTVETTANGTATTVANLQQSVNNLGQVNQLFNTEFSPDLEGWYASPNLNSQSYPTTNTLLVKSNLSYSGSNAVMIDYSGQTADYAGYTKMYPDIVNVYGHSTLSWRMTAYLEQVSSNSATYFNAVIDFFDKDMTFISNAAGNMFNKSKIGTWQDSSDNNSAFLNVSVPSNAYYAGFKLYPRGQFKIHLSKPMLVFDSPTVGAYVAGAYNNNAALAQVKITADSISNFVRDSSGNISSDFQTALSKTSIITGSTLASSIQQQTSSQITQALTDNNKNIIAMINLDTSGVQIAGKNIILDGTVTMTNGFTVGSANIANAAIQTVNIADAAITNAKIATLDVAKITGNVSSFIQSNWNGQFGSTTIDSTGMQVVTGKAKTKFGQGAMSIISDAGENIGWIGRQVDSTYTNLDYLVFGLNGWHTTYPGDVHYDETGTNTDQFYGGDGVIFGISSADGGYMPLLQWNSDLAASYRQGRRGWMFTQPIVAGLNIYTENSKNDDNGIIIQPQTIDGVYYPVMTSMSSAGATGYAIGSGASYMYAGNTRILRADSNGYLYYQTGKTGSSGKSLLMTSDGAIIAQSSATKYKTDIQYEKDTSFGDKLLTIDPATWADKNEAEQIAEFNKTGKEPDYAMNKDGARYYGLIAEDMVKAGLEELVIRDTITGAVEGIQYEKIGAALIPLLREQRNQINELKVEIERLKVKTSE